jgi:hypothetical protein
MSVNYNDLLITYCSKNELEKLKDLFEWAENDARRKTYFRSWETPIYKYPTNYSISYNDALAYSCAKNAFDCMEWLFKNKKFAERSNDSFEKIMNGAFKNAFVNNNKKIMDYLVKNQNESFTINFNEHFKYACKKCSVEIVEYIYANYEISLSSINEGFINSCENKNIEVAKWLKKIYLPLQLLENNNKITKYSITENIYNRYELLLKNNVIIYKLDEKQKCVCCNKINSNLLLISCGHYYCIDCFHTSKKNNCKKCSKKIHQFHFKYYELNPKGNLVKLNNQIINKKPSIFSLLICGSNNIIEEPSSIKYGDYYIPGKIDDINISVVSTTSNIIPLSNAPIVGIPPNINGISTISSVIAPIPSAPPTILMNTADVQTVIPTSPPQPPPTTNNIEPVTAGKLQAEITNNETSNVSSSKLDSDDPIPC